MRRHLTPSLVISCIALFVALSGTGYAVSKLPKNSVGTKQLKSNSVTTSKVKDGSLKLTDFNATERTGLKGDKGETGPSDAWFIDGIGQAQAVVIPPGSYTAAGMVSFGSATNPECIIHHTTSPSSSTGRLSWGAVNGAQYTLPLADAFTVTEPTTKVYVTCTGGGVSFVVPAVAVTKVGKLTN